METFREAVLRLVTIVPKGKVVSYGQVAAAAGQPRAPRQVGAVLRSMSGEESQRVPWWRVINSQGYISIKGNWTATKEVQRELLLREGVAVSPELKIDLQTFGFSFKTF